MPQNSEEKHIEEDMLENEKLSEEEWNEMTNEEKNEYKSIQRALDQINCCLDALERKNDTLNAQLRELLESNRAARQLAEVVETNPNQINQE